MLNVLLALLPSAAAGVWYFGTRALMLLCVSTASAVVAEYLWQKLGRHPVRVGDLSAAVTGLILGLILPPTATWWMAVVGSAFAIIVVKQLFGGIGDNFLNPAMAARAVLLASWPARMTAYVTASRFGADAVSAATPLAHAVDAASAATPLAHAVDAASAAASLAHGADAAATATVLAHGADASSAAATLASSVESSYSYLELFLGSIPGAIGETCKVAILAGLLLLLLTRTVTWRIPVVMLGSTAFFSWILGFDPLYAVLSGGVLFAAAFMANDYATSPMSSHAQVVYAAGIGLITVVIRNYGSYPEGVTYAVLFMNILTPLLDRFMPHKIYGHQRVKEAKKA